MKENSGLAFNGQGGAGYSRMKSGECVNEYTGYANDGRLINKGRGPTGGSTKVPATSGGKGAQQYRGVGGTTVKKMSPEAKIDFKRGPTKGNQ